MLRPSKLLQLLHVVVLVQGKAVGNDDEMAAGLLPLSQVYGARLRGEGADNIFSDAKVYNHMYNGMYNEAMGQEANKGYGFDAMSDEVLRQRQQWLDAQSGIQVVEHFDNPNLQPVLTNHQGVGLKEADNEELKTADNVGWWPPMREPMRPPSMSEMVSVVSVCEWWICEDNCRRHLGMAKGICVGNECYCQPPENLAGTEWSYENQEAWPTLFPSCGSQGMTAWSSPVALRAEKSQNLDPVVTLNNFDSPMALIVENIGHTIRLLVQSSSSLPTLTLSTSRLSALNGFDVGLVKDRSSSSTARLTLAQMELHWPTSEHTVDSSSSSMELQLHHFNMDDYPHFEEALEEGAVVTLAVFFEINDNESVLKEAIFEAVRQNERPNDLGTLIKEDSYLAFLQNELTPTLAVYRGTQTSPPCRQMTWLVATDTNFPVLASQIEILTYLRDNAGQRIVSNVRDVQQPAV